MSDKLKISLRDGETRKPWPAWPCPRNASAPPYW